jgi:site-specific DNA-methyltransferase (adenine-specific)
VTPAEWSEMRARFVCPHGVTNVWDRRPVHGAERVRAGGGAGRAVHLNQKPIDLMERIVEASTNEGEVVWEPFGGLFTASLAAARLGRRAFAAEIDPTYYQYGVARFTGTRGSPR